MEQKASRKASGLVRVLQAALALAGVLAVPYLMLTFRPDPNAPVRRAHIARGEALGLARPVPVSFRNVPLLSQRRQRPLWEAPEHDPLLMRLCGLSPWYRSALVTYTFRDAEEEARARTAARGRSLVAVARFLQGHNSWAAPPPPELFSDSPDALQCFRPTFEPMMEALAEDALRTGEEPFSDEYLGALPTIIAWLERRGREGDALALLDRWLQQTMANRELYGIGEWQHLATGLGPGPALNNLPAWNPVAEAAILLDACGASDAFLDRIARALETDVPPPEKLAWLAEQARFDQYEAGLARHQEDLHDTRESPLRHFAAGVPETILIAIHRPLLVSQYADFFAAWQRADIPAAMEIRRAYAATASRINLRQGAIDYSYGSVRHESTATWCRFCTGEPPRLGKVEMARFVVSALRHRRSHGTWPDPSVGPDGSRWEVEDAPAFQAPLVRDDPSGSRLRQFREYADETGEVPQPDGLRTIPIGPRPIFLRTGPADPCSFGFLCRLSADEKEPPDSQEEAERLRIAKDLVAGRNEFLQVEAFVPISIPTPALVRLMEPLP